MRIRIIGTIILLGLVLSGCTTSGLFDIEGEYSVVGTVTESTTPNRSVGDLLPDTFVVAESSGTVFVGVTNGALKGTRTNNTVNVLYATEDTQAEFTLTWTSDTTFEGTGRTDDLGDGTYWEYDLSGTASASVSTAATTSPFLD